MTYIRFLAVLMMNLAALMKKFLIPLPMEEAMLAPIEAWQGSAMTITTTRVHAKVFEIAMFKILIWSKFVKFVLKKLKKTWKQHNNFENPELCQIKFFFYIFGKISPNQEIETWNVKATFIFTFIIKFK